MDGRVGECTLTGLAGPTPGHACDDRFFQAGYERLVLPGVGHFVPREAPSRVAETILRLAGPGG